MNENEKLTWDDIKAMFAETAKRSKETDKQLDKVKKLVSETTRQMKETDKKIVKMNEDSKQKIDELNRQLGGISKSNGDMAEDFFFNAFRKDKIFMGEKYDRIHKGYFSSVDPYRNEYDIVFFNGKNIAIIEVKYKAKPSNIDVEHLKSRIEHFKKYAKEYKNHNIILGVAAMSFKSGFATKLHEEGIVTIHPVGKKMVIYDKEAKRF
ncbi:MAG: hypothetical protein FWC34_09915 [Bacteroidetes bacterium]|nr:hypothetical protein [Bacteroidota bacterium]MCL2301888.1 hypothetical protein [Lentimicrobiaceae bacterium]